MGRAYKVFEEITNDREEWSDWKCYQIAKQDSFPEIVKDITVQKNIINTYFNFYLSGQLPKGVSVTDIIFATIAIMPKSWTNEEFVWDERLDWYSNNGTLFFISSEHRLSTEINNIISKTSKINDKYEQIDGSFSHKTETKSRTCSPVTTESNSKEETPGCSENQQDSTESATSENKEVEKIIWVSKKQRQNHQKSESYKEYTPEDNAKFCSFVNNVLKKWDEDESHRICLKYYFGLTCLILMRTITMSYKKVTHAFESLSYRDVERLILTYHSVPDKKCIKKSFKAFRSNDKNIQIMFAKLVVNSRLVDVTRASNNHIRDIFRLGLLSHTVHFKMDLIKLIEGVVSHVDFENLMDVLNVPELAESRQKIYSFVKKYMTYYDGNILHTCHWAPIIERHQFQDLTCSSNFGFSVVIAVFKEKSCMNSDIWKATWVKNGDKAQLHTYKQLGAKLYKKYEESCHSALSLQFLKIEDILRELL